MSKKITVTTKNVSGISWHGNEFNLKKALSNIFENAIKYSEEKTKISLETEEYKNNILIKIKDQGPGISQKIIDNISIFSKTQSETKNGFGLFVTNNLVTSLKGKLDIQTTSKGSTFVVSLPISI